MIYMPYAGAVFLCSRCPLWRFIMSRKGYPSDLTDEQWAILEPLLPRPKKIGRPREVDLREIINAILYVTRAGCAWRMLPGDFPHCKTVFYYFTKWRKCGVWKKIHDKLVEQARQKAGKEPKPTAAIIDSQSVKTGEKGGPRAVMMLARKLKDANDILPSIPWDLSLD